MTATQPKLPKVFKRKWVEALRSGDYKQGNGQLYRIETNAYCCLGVAAKVHGTDNSLLMEKGFLQKGMVPDLVLGSLHRGSRVGGTREGSLVDKNDRSKWSFKKIASYIERYL